MSSLRRIGARIRNQYLVAKVLVTVFRPLNNFLLFLSRHIQMKIKVNGGRVQFDGFTLSVPQNVGIGFVSNIYWKGIEGFEPYTWQVIRETSRNADVFVDVGSHFGFYSVLVQKLNANIITRCYEPLPALYNDNILFHKANEATRQIIFNKAVSAEPGSVEIQIPVHDRENEIRSASVEKDFYFNRRFKTRALTVATTSLDADFEANIGDFAGKRVVVKIDIEGHEWAAVQGALTFLKRVKPVLICEVDRSSDHLVDLLSCFERLGFSIYAIAKEGVFLVNYGDVYRFKGGRDFLISPIQPAQSYVPFSELNAYVWQR